jgi:orotidine-5'-phosphate decarboxylase
MIKPHDRIIFALDVSTSEEAWRYINLLKDHVGIFKVGYELFLSAPSILQRMSDKNIPIMLDFKLHDIPTTVQKAIIAAGEYNIKFMTLHIQQSDTLIMAKEAADQSGIALLGITVLTSMLDRDLQDLSLEGCTKKRAAYLANFAFKFGINGFVCSTQDIAEIRYRVPGSIIVVPGIRLPEPKLQENPLSAVAEAMLQAGLESAKVALASGLMFTSWDNFTKYVEDGDQKRIGTPSEAIKDGADYLVVGRPIRLADSPVVAANLIAQEIESQLTNLE